MYKEMEIYFSDLNKDAQERLLELVGADSPADMNWDMDVFPLFTYTPENS